MGQIFDISHTLFGAKIGFLLYFVFRFLGCQDTIKDQF